MKSRKNHPTSIGSTYWQGAFFILGGAVLWTSVAMAPAHAASQQKKMYPPTVKASAKGDKLTAPAGHAAPKGGAHEANEKWYSWFWPLGDHVEVEALKHEYVPFKTEKSITLSRKQVLDPQQKQVFDPQAPSGLSQASPQGKLIPGRPKLLSELGNGFLDTGKLGAGFEVPVIGAVWQPRLWSYLINRTSFQTFDSGRSGQRETEIANRLDFFTNLQLTGTEKILLGIRATDNNRPDQFTRYTFEGASEGFNNELDFNIETLFFEGDLGSLFPVLDKKGNLPIDLGFTVGRQPVVFQEGILINDTIDAVGFIRNNIPLAGTSNFRVSGMWGWNRLNRNNDTPSSEDENMFGLFLGADAQLSTYNLDMIYVDDPNEGDGFYIGASAIQRLPYFGGISTAFRINSSFALEDEIPGNVIGNGTLITVETSKAVKGSDDIAYFNTFLGIGNFTQAGREAIVGGPLANTGILFASPNLSTYGAELDPFTSDDVVGGAIGYQAFWDNKRRNLILEVAGRHDLGGDGFDSVALGLQLQQAVGSHVQLQFESFYAFNEDRDDGFGARAEIQLVY